VTAKSVLMRPQGLHLRARFPLASPLLLATSLQCVLEFQSDHAQLRSRGHASRSVGFEAASAHFIQTFTKLVFQQTLGPKYV